MQVYIAKSFNGAILGVYANEEAARAHLEDLSIIRDSRNEWRHGHLYVDSNYAGRVEPATVFDSYTRYGARFAEARDA